VGDRGEVGVSKSGLASSPFSPAAASEVLSLSVRETSVLDLVISFFDNGEHSAVSFSLNSNTSSGLDSSLGIVGSVGSIEGRFVEWLEITVSLALGASPLPESGAALEVDPLLGPPS
jgi:hypothetical protein